ncbi:MULTISPECIES: hypothetical protein [Bacillales]|uniref:hypothetical protein n=1 Tax=Bacillales TaxID=1385 RepID=UPI0006A793AD|nr:MULTISPECIES: hypothetical protein [Bacillales]OBZ13157.1 hypothetical protein A7975_09755 [Bacillus sp. FJAT-26390]
MKRLYAILFILLWVSGCSVEKDSENDGEAATIIKQQTAIKVNEANKMPKDMPGNFDFMVRFGYGEVNKNEINTFQGTVTKDLIMNGTASAKVTFTLEEKRSIYAKMREINIMGAKELMPASVGCEVVPYSEDSWEINVNGETKIFTWTDKHCEITNDAKQMLELRSFIQQIVEAKEEYKKLPESEGGYE